MRRTALAVMILAGMACAVSAIANAQCSGGCACSSCFTMWDGGTQAGFKMSAGYNPICRGGFLHVGPPGGAAVSCTEPVMIRSSSAVTSACSDPGIAPYVVGTTCAGTIGDEVQTTTCGCLND